MAFRASLLLLLPLFALDVRPAGAIPPGRTRVRLLPLGKFPPGLGAVVERALRAELRVEVEWAPALSLPKRAYYPARRRYRADRLLDFLNARFAALPPTTRVLGLTTVDISTTKGMHADWGVFGLGELGGRAAVLSSFRLRRGARSTAQLRLRVASSAVHEVGHTLGLEHCDEPRCVMQDAGGTIRNTDTGTGRLGPLCRARLRLVTTRAP